MTPIFQKPHTHNSYSANVDCHKKRSGKNLTRRSAHTYILCRHTFQDHGNVSPHEMSLSKKTEQKSRRDYLTRASRPQQLAV